LNKAIRGRSIDTIFVLIVFSIFAFSVLMVLMLGANIYRNINDLSRYEQYEHTALSYVWTKTKNFDDADSISVGNFNGLTALFIDEKIGGTEFRTVIYHYDGWLFELFSEATLDFSIEDGIRIIRTEELFFEEIGNGLIKVTTGRMQLLLSPRGGFDVQIIGGNE